MSKLEALLLNQPARKKKKKIATNPPSKKPQVPISPTERNKIEKPPGTTPSWNPSEVAMINLIEKEEQRFKSIGEKNAEILLGKNKIRTDVTCDIPGNHFIGKQIITQ